MDNLTQQNELALIKHEVSTIAPKFTYCLSYFKRQHGLLLKAYNDFNKKYDSNYSSIDKKLKLLCSANDQMALFKFESNEKFSRILLFTEQFGIFESKTSDQISQTSDQISQLVSFKEQSTKDFLSLNEKFDQILKRKEPNLIVIVSVFFNILFLIICFLK